MNISLFITTKTLLTVVGSNKLTTVNRSPFVNHDPRQLNTMLLRRGGEHRETRVCNYNSSFLSRWAIIC